VRDIDLSQIQKAQQAAERPKAGRGAPASGQDYVFTGAPAGLLNVNPLRDRVWYPTPAKAGLRRRITRPGRSMSYRSVVPKGDSFGPPFGTSRHALVFVDSSRSVKHFHVSGG
jgi:hypothetical protein